MRRRSAIPAALALAFVGAGCSELDLTEVPQSDITPAFSTVEECETIDFNEFGQGDNVNSVEVFGMTINVSTVSYPPYIDPGTGLPPDGEPVAGTDQAVAFETDGLASAVVYEDIDLQWRGESFDMTPPDDFCLQCEGLERILVILDSRGFNPWGDSRWGGTITFSGFDPDVYTITTFDAVDDDGGEPSIDLFMDAEVVAAAQSAGTGDHTVETVDVNDTFNSSFRFELGTEEVDATTGSGGIDNIEICRTIVEGDEGCTPGYWKNHEDSWAATGYSPAQTLESVFDVPDGLALDNVTLLNALSFGGGPGVAGAARILLRAAVAGLLNASHPDVDYTTSAAALIADVNAALASGDRATMLALATEIDTDNNLGCPIN